MKILYICNEYPPYQHGGIGSFTRDIAEAMLKAGNEVYVWGVYATLTEKVEEYINGIIITRETCRPDGGRLNSVLFRIKFRQKLEKFLFQNKFDIVECQEWQGLLPFGLGHPGYVVRLHGAAVFFDVLLNRKGGRLTHWYEKQMLKNAENLVAVSQFCGEETLKICDLENKPFTVIYNSIDTERIVKFKQETFEEYKIVFANTVSRKKGVFELVEAFNIIAEKFPKATLYIIGKLHYTEGGVNIKDLLLEMVNPKFGDRLQITGWLNCADEVFEHISSAHVCVYPSHMEGFGIAPVEPMVLGKPVLFMNNGPGPEVIEDKVSGLLVDSHSPEDIAENIEYIFENPKLANEMSANAMNRVSRLFDKNGVFLKNNDNYYHSLLHEN
jgi:glycosyltransferase involved in cell wall biosynthesis